MVHRITESAGADSKARYGENERVRKLDCNESIPGAPAAGKDCEEYPFCSSAEGVARYLYEGTGDEFKDDFSVRYIDSAETRKPAAAWYHSDRILNWEAFTVSIGD
ncbi:NucA/NucB deoxyribonuclease domain-containing protein [Streptomyces niveus]|uniref:NucA/NucB deoxyribonuclease domain-containing protein n=1 Tax=Streptomyces niveus TaxID=193462 RepID=UPI003642F5AD